MGSIEIVWILVYAALVLMMQPGFICLEIGLVRSKNGLHIALKNILDLRLSGLIFWDDTAIVKTIAAMAHTRKLNVTAEGVETTEQLEFLGVFRLRQRTRLTMSAPPPRPLCWMLSGGFRL